MWMCQLLMGILGAAAVPVAAGNNVMTVGDTITVDSLEPVTVLS